MKSGTVHSIKSGKAQNEQMFSGLPRTRISDLRALVAAEINRLSGAALRTCEDASRTRHTRKI